MTWIGAGRKVGARTAEDGGPYGVAIRWFGIVGAAISRPVYSLKFSPHSRRRVYNAIFAVFHKRTRGRGARGRWGRKDARAER